MNRILEIAMAHNRGYEAGRASRGKMYVRRVPESVEPCRDCGHEYCDKAQVTYDTRFCCAVFGDLVGDDKPFFIGFNNGEVTGVEVPVAEDDEGFFSITLNYCPFCGAEIEVVDQIPEVRNANQVQ